MLSLVLIVCIVIEESKGIKEGTWDSIHVVNVSLEQKKARYRVASTVFLKMQSSNPVYGDLEIAGSLSRSVCTCCINSYEYRKKTNKQWMLRVEMISILLTLED